MKNEGMAELATFGKLRATGSAVLWLVAQPTEEAYPADAGFCDRDELPTWKPAFGFNRLPLFDPGAVFLPGRQASQHAAVRVPHPDRFADFNSSGDVAAGQS